MGRGVREPEGTTGGHRRGALATSPVSSRDSCA
jgi:hypothetical protein